VAEGIDETKQLNFPDDRRYSKEHVWLMNSEGKVFVGISDFAQNQLGEIIFVDLPSIGETFDQNQEFGVVESTKTVSELYMPVTGKVSSINAHLEDEPTLINQSPYIEGWIIAIEPDPTAVWNDLMSKDEYLAFLDYHQDE
jgi:glycine cleavage system H protein